MSGHPALWIAFAASFLLGSLPFGLWVARVFYREDIRASGSGNIGATNVSRVVGFWPAGFITFVLDLLKGLLPAAILAHAGPELFGFEGFEPSLADAWVVGFFAVLGHCYSPWLRFRGGKGVSTSLGVFLILSPFAALVGIGIFAVFFGYSRIASISSISGVCIAAAFHVMLYSAGKELWPILAIVFLVLIRHESNLDAFLHGRERTFGNRT